MTHVEDSKAASAASRRNEIDLVQAQLRGIEQLTQAVRLAEDTTGAATRSRELRMDAARELEILRRHQSALIARTHEQLQESGTHPMGTAATTVVLVHRNEWFAGKVSEALAEGGCVVLPRLENGADALGLVVAEQPDLVLVEDKIPMVPAARLIQDIRKLCPDTLVAAHVSYGDDVGPMLEAGAAQVFTRQVPPAEVASALLTALTPK